MVYVIIKNRVRRHKISFKCAFAGLAYAFRTQPNFVVHLIAAALVLLAAHFFKVSKFEILSLLLVISIVFVAEIINTALETTVDLVTEEYHPKAKIAKDLMSAAVLTAALASVVVGLVIFLPHLVELVISGN